MIDNLNFIIYTPFMKILIFLFINSQEIFPDRLYKVKIGLTKQTGELSYEICNMECKRLQSSTEERL